MKENRITNSERLRTLESYKLMDSLPETVYDDITKLAAAICCTPVSLITLVDDKRQFFKSHHGLAFNETPLEDSFCKYLIQEDTELFIVEDARKDKRFSNNSLVLNHPNISFYAGVSLTSPTGERLGSLCVIDHQPKKLTDIQIMGLKTLSFQVIQLFEFRLSKKEIEKKNEELAKILDTSLDVICTLDKEGCFLTISQASERIWGYTPDELIGKKYDDIVLKEDIALRGKSTKCVISGHSENNFENRVIHKNGHLLSMLWSSRANKEDGIVYCVAKDITEKKKAEEQLQHSERRFKTLVQEGTDLIAILDLEATYTYVSPTSIKVLQTRPEEFIGTNAFDYIHPDDKEAVLAQFGQILEISHLSIKPFRFKNKVGEWRWVETFLTNQLNEPTITGIVANSRDVTDRILYLKAIEEQNLKLKEIAWTQSHIVRAPVARLMGLINLIREEELDVAEKDQVLNFIINSADEIDTVIKNIVEHSIHAIDIE